MADYRQELTEKLSSARKRVKLGREMKALKAGAPALFEIIDGEAQLIYTKVFGETPLPYDEYLSAHGEMRNIKRIRNLIDAKEVDEVMAANEAAAIQANLDQMKQDDKKQQ